MSWLFDRIYLFWRWLQMTADESGQLSESSAQTDSGLSGNASPAGSSQPPQEGDQVDINERPVGRCHNERNRLIALVKQAREIESAIQDALTAYWDCRDAASAEIGAKISQSTRRLAQATFEIHREDLDWIERQLETPE
jgi:hypothetical protein